ncbi:MAG: rod shape-determining protein RodA [Candidatus Adiutrix sp.]|jgi:rod shape determining protein RodA|nr:rod shape-determining protein RodA [Candidatus Adiutrix sp.]
MKLLSLDRRLLENFCWPLILSMLALCCCGLLNLFSVSAYNYAGEAWSWFARQAGFLGLALGLLFVILLVDYQYLKRFIWPLYGLSLALLAATLAIGTEINGAVRWLDLGLVRFQPSESAKVVVVAALAAWFAKRDWSAELGFRELVVPGLIIGLPFLLIHKQPDLGTALHLLATCAPMFLAFRLRPRLVLSLVMVGAVSLGVVGLAALTDSWPFLVDRGILKPHQARRIETFLSPASDPSNHGWQILQSQNAVGGGQIFGRGFMAGPQQKNGFLPEAETDFAFAALAEEWGFVGCLTVLALFLVLLGCGLQVARRSKDCFGSLIAVGLTSFLFWQVFINVAMVTGLLPVVGIPLPFISYGGTSLVVTVAAVGLMQNVSMRRYMFKDDPVRENPGVWRQQPEERPRPAPTKPVRRLAADTPLDPELHPPHRLPHIRPWAKYLRGGRRI